MRILKWWRWKIITFVWLKCLGTFFLCQKFSIWVLGFFLTSWERLILCDFEKVINFHFILSFPIFQIPHLFNHYAIWILFSRHFNLCLLFTWLFFLILCATSPHHRWKLSLLHLGSFSIFSNILLFFFTWVAIELRGRTNDHWAWVLSFSQFSKSIIISWSRQKG